MTSNGVTTADDARYLCSNWASCSLGHFGNHSPNFYSGQKVCYLASIFDTSRFCSTHSGFETKQSEIFYTPLAARIIGLYVISWTCCSSVHVLLRKKLPQKNAGGGIFAKSSVTQQGHRKRQNWEHSLPVRSKIADSPKWSIFRELSTADCSISHKFGIDFDHVTAVQVKGSKPQRSRSSLDVTVLLMIG